MISESRVRTAKPTEKPCRLSDGRGLYLHVVPAGGRYWRFNYRFNGRQKTLALGIYPDVPLAKARERHQEARRQLAEGIDPGVVKQAINSDFEAVAKAWVAHWQTGRSERYVTSVLARLEADVFPKIGCRPVTELATSDFRDVARAIEDGVLQRSPGNFSRTAAKSCGTPWPTTLPSAIPLPKSGPPTS